MALEVNPSLTILQLCDLGQITALSEPQFLQWQREGDKLKKNHR